MLYTYLLYYIVYKNDRKIVTYAVKDAVFLQNSFKQQLFECGDRELLNKENK